VQAAASLRESIHVGRPAATTDQNVLSVDVEGNRPPMALISEVTSRMPKLGFGTVAGGAVNLEFHLPASKRFGLPICAGQPQPRNWRKISWRKLLRSEGDVFRFVSGEFDVLPEFDVLDLPFQLAFDRMARCRFSVVR